jgi:hypothetical protein
MSPSQISHAKLLKPGPIRMPAGLPRGAGDELSALRSMRLGVENAGDDDQRTRTWSSIAIVKAAAVQTAANKTEDARRIALKTGAEASKAAKAQRRAEGARIRVENQLGALAVFAGAVEPLAIVPIDELRNRAFQHLLEVNKEVEALRNDAQARINATLAAREQVKLAQAAWIAAQHEAEVAEAKAAPISVFISRKTQRLYARQASRPIFESDVAIDAPEEPLGTFVFTALAPGHGGAELHWAALAMYANPANPGTQLRQTAAGRTPARPTPTDILAAKAALDRISIPPEALDEISEYVSPGSSLIISDEEMSKDRSSRRDPCRNSPSGHMDC